MYERFHQGEKFVNAQDQVFSIAHLSNSSVFFESEEFGAAPFAVTVNEFKEQLQKEVLASAFELSNEIDKLDACQQKHLEKRKPYLTILKKLYAEGAHPTSVKTYETLCSKAQELTHSCKHPGKSTINKWWKAYKQASFCIEKSLPKQPRVPKRLSKESEMIVNTYVHDTWLAFFSNNIARAYKLYEFEMKEKAINGKCADIASESTFRRRLLELNHYDEVTAAGNYNDIKKANRTMLKKINTSRALERVEMDRATFNISLLDDETLKPTGNLSIFAAIDCNNRIPIGLTLEFGEAESSRGTLNLIKQIFIPASKDLNFSGIPEKLIGDNGSGFIAEKTNSVLEKLKTEYIRTPTGQAWKKPFVESFFNTLRKEFFEGLAFTDKEGNKQLGIPGYLGKRTDKRNTRPAIENIAKAAQITVSEFQQALHDYLVLFINSAHSQLNGLSPAEKWKETQSEQPIVPVNYDDIAHYFRVNEERRILESRGTITLNHQKYASRELKSVYNELALVKDSKTTPYVTVKYDPDDARFISVIYQIPGKGSAHTIEVPHRDCSESELPISFDELNKSRVAVTRRALFVANFTPHKQKIKPRSTGKKVADLNSEFSNGLNAKDIIEKNNITKPLKTQVSAVQKTKMSDKKNKNKTKCEPLQGDLSLMYSDWDEE